MKRALQLLLSDIKFDGLVVTAVAEYLGEQDNCFMQKKLLKPW